MKLDRTFVVFGLSWVLIGSTAGLAQEHPADSQAGNLSFVVDGGYELTFDTDIDDSSEFDLSTAYFKIHDFDAYNNFKSVNSSTVV